MMRISEVESILSDYEQSAYFDENDYEYQQLLYVSRPEFEDWESEKY